jgi:hypothetical protein
MVASRQLLAHHHTHDGRRTKVLQTAEHNLSLKQYNKYILNGCRVVSYITGCYNDYFDRRQQMVNMV